jgi:hypothetical protein
MSSCRDCTSTCHARGIVSGWLRRHENALEAEAERALPPCTLTHRRVPRPAHFVGLSNHYDGAERFRALELGNSAICNAAWVLLRHTT